MEVQGFESRLKKEAGCFASLAKVGSVTEKEIKISEQNIERVVLAKKS